MSDEIIEHYETTTEENRLAVGLGQLELVRTKEILTRYLPAAPASVLDVGGGTGVHARWLAGAGYQVHLVDLTPRHVAKVEAELGPLGVTGEVGDARVLSAGDASVDVVLLFGPLYHLQALDDRLLALREAARVVKPGGLIAVAAINRFASLFDGLAREFLFDDDFKRVVERDLADGCHSNVAEHEHWFTTAYFHRPEDLRREAIEAGLDVEGVFGVEGLAGWLAHLDPRWAEERDRQTILDAARVVETEPALMGLSAHLLLVARSAVRSADGTSGPRT